MREYIEDFYSVGQERISLINDFAQKHQLEDKALADHIGYKCESTPVYEQMRSLFETNSTYIYQSIISERRISIIKLKKPFVTSLGEINYLELSDQKPDGSQKNGFDHVEIYPTGMSFGELVQFVQMQGETGEASIKPHHSTHNFSLAPGFTLKIEPCELIQKIKVEEM